MSKDALSRADCPIKVLGTDLDGQTYYFLNDNNELVSQKMEELGSAAGMRALFTKKESIKWARRHWPSKSMH